MLQLLQSYIHFCHVFSVTVFVNVKYLRVTAVNGKGLWTKKEMLVPQESLLLPWDQQVHICDINWPRNKKHFRLIISTNRVTCFFLMSVNRNFQKKKKHVS